MERDLDCFAAKDCGLQMVLGVYTRAGFDDESAVSRCLDLYIDSTTDCIDLLFGPENVDFTEGEGFVTGLRHQVRALGVHVLVSQVRARVYVPGRVRGRARASFRAWSGHERGSEVWAWSGDERGSAWVWSSVGRYRSGEAGAVAGTAELSEGRGGSGETGLVGAGTVSMEAKEGVRSGSRRSELEDELDSDDLRRCLPPPMAGKWRG